MVSFFPFTLNVPAPQSSTSVPSGMVLFASRRSVPCLRWVKPV